MKSKLLMPLLVALAGLLAWVWITDRRSPAYPTGQFTPLVVQAALAIGVIWARVMIIRRWK